MPTSTTVFFSRHFTCERSRLPVVPVLNGVIFGKRPYIFAVVVPVRRHPGSKTKDPGHRAEGQTMRAIKVILILVVLGFAGLTGFAYLGDLTPPVTGISQSLTVPAATDGN